MKIALLVFTDGRLDMLTRCIRSANEQLKCDLALKVIFNDEPSVNPQFKGYITSNTQKRSGYSRSIQRAWDGLPSDIDYIFHLEDDFVFNEPIPIMDIISILELNPKLAQMALLRQPVNEEEKAAGGILQAHPERWVEQVSWHESNFCFTLNPCVYPVYITKFPYPQKKAWPWGEGEFSAFLRDHGYWFGMWGSTPQTTHIGRPRRRAKIEF